MGQLNNMFSWFIVDPYFGETFLTFAHPSATQKAVRFSRRPGNQLNSLPASSKKIKQGQNSLN